MARTAQGTSPAPTMMCLVSAGQCTKSHCRSGRSSPSTTSSASPESTRNSSWSASQWYMPMGSPGASTKRLTPTCGNSVSPSKSRRAPGPSACSSRASGTINAPSGIRTSVRRDAERCRRFEAARAWTPRAGFEPAAYSLGGSRSIQLSYRGLRASLGRWYRPLVGSERRSMEGRVLRRGGLMRSWALAVVVGGMLALAPGASAAAPKDYADTALNIIPSGQYGSIPPPTGADTQAKMYDGLTPLFDDVTNADLTQYFKSEKFGISPAGPGTTESVPRPGVT